MTDSEIVKKLNALSRKIGDAQKLKQSVGRTKAIMTQLEQAVGPINDLLGRAESIREQFDNITQQVQTTTNTLNELKVGQGEYSQQVKDQIAGLEELKKEYNELVDLTKDQLGIVSMEMLANAFSSEAKVLKKGVATAFWWFLGSVLTLTVVLGLISYWQIQETGNLLDPSFWFKVPLAAPVIYFVITMGQQYIRNKHLLDEYNFKAAMARSLESYRKILGEEADSATGEGTENFRAGMLKFVIEVMQQIYSSPMKNIKKHAPKDDVGFVTRIVKKVTGIKDADE